MKKHLVIAALAATMSYNTQAKVSINEVIVITSQENPSEEILDDNVQTEKVVVKAPQKNFSEQTLTNNTQNKISIEYDIPKFSCCRNVNGSPTFTLGDGRKFVIYQEVISGEVFAYTSSRETLFVSTDIKIDQEKNYEGTLFIEQNSIKIINLKETGPSWHGKINSSASSTVNMGLQKAKDAQDAVCEKWEEFKSKK